MSDKRGYFDHYQENGGMWVQRKLTTTPVFDRLTRKRRGSTALPIGAWVRVKNSQHLLGQVWAQGPHRYPGYWWIADGATYHLRHQDTLEIAASPTGDVELILTA